VDRGDGLARGRPAHIARSVVIIPNSRAADGDGAEWPQYIDWRRNQGLTVRCVATPGPGSVALSARCRSGATGLVYEFFGSRRIANRREVAVPLPIIFAGK
jgi:hypothetical protein